MKTDALTAARLKELLHYDPETGVFTWIAGGCLGRNRRHKTAGTKHRRGYIQIQIDGVIYKAHRLAWLYVHGQWPTGLIDHRNGVQDENRFGNLRDATFLINSQNRRGPQRNTSSGLLGAHKHQNAFTSRIRVDGAIKHLGSFKSAEEAHAAYLTAKRQLHEGCTI